MNDMLDNLIPIPSGLNFSVIESNQQDIPVQHISQNYIRQLSKLKLKKYRDEYGWYMISGLNAVKSALEAPHLRIIEVLVHERRTELLSELSFTTGIPVFLLNDKDFIHLSDEQTPQGIALVAQKRSLRLQNSAPDENILLYLHQVNDPGNLGTIIRAALWFGVRAILLSSNSTDPFQPKVVRASTGYLTHLNIYEEVDEESLTRLQSLHGYRLIAATAEGGRDISRYGFDGDEKKILLFGSEAHGLPPALLEQCNDRISIPKTGYGESLNLAVSAGVCLFQMQSVAHSK